MKKAHRLLSVALLGAALSAAAHADVKETAHEAKENLKAAGKKMGEDLHKAPHEMRQTVKAAGHAIASGAHEGFDATKHAIRRAVGKEKQPVGEARPAGESN